MIPLHRTPLGRLKICKDEPKVVERGLIVHERLDLRAEISRAYQIPRAFEICSPHTNWKKPRGGIGRMYRQFPRDTTLPHGVGSILVKPMISHEGEWTNCIEIPEHRYDKTYQNGKRVQWGGVPPEVFHPSELLTTEQFLAECKTIREKKEVQKALDLKIMTFETRFEDLGFRSVSVSENRGEIQIDCSESDLLRILEQLGL